MHKIRQRYRYSIILLRELVRTDFKLRYQGSVLGYLWSLLRPFLLFIILYFVFTVFLSIGKGVPHYPVYLLTGIVLWNYFTEVTMGGVGSIVGKGDLLRKLNFPRYVIIVSGSLSALINLCLNSIIITIFLIANHVSISWHALLIIPLLAELFIIAISLSFLLSALYVRFRDLNYIWEVILQASFYATPIIYPVSRIANVHLKIAKILILNPMAQVIQDIRHVLITPKATIVSGLYGGNKWIYAIPIGLVLITALVSTAYFKKNSKYFAEEV